MFITRSQAFADEGARRMGKKKGENGEGKSGDRMRKGESTARRSPGYYAAAESMRFALFISRHLCPR